MNYKRAKILSVVYYKFLQMFRFATALSSYANIDYANDKRALHKLMLSRDILSIYFSVTACVIKG